MDGAKNRGEALRWLTAAEKLLLASDLQGCRSFAIRARESDPGLDAPEMLLVVVDTLIAAEYRINHHHDWYAILQVARYTQNMDVIANQYQRLAVILDPNRNKIPFSAEAFRVVSDAWFVLSDPSRKAMYDNNLRFLTEPTTHLQLQQQTYQQQNNEPHYEYQQHYQPPQQPQPLQFHPLQPQPLQFQPLQPQSVRKSPSSEDCRTAAEEERPSLNLGPGSTRQTPTNEFPNPVQTECVSTTQRQPTTTTEPTRSVPASEVPTFWTACPYCYVLYEYPMIYEECTLSCQQCKRAFHAVRVPSPPVTEKATYFCTWGFFPVGCSGKFSKGRKQNVHMGPRVYLNDDDVFVEISSSDEESDDDFEIRSRNVKNSMRKTTGRKYGTKAQIGRDVR